MSFFIKFFQDYLDDDYVLFSYVSFDSVGVAEDFLTQSKEHLKSKQVYLCSPDIREYVPGAEELQPKPAKPATLEVFTEITKDIIYYNSLCKPGSSDFLIVKHGSLTQPDETKEYLYLISKHEEIFDWFAVFDTTLTEDEYDFAKFIAARPDDKDTTLDWVSNLRGKLQKFVKDSEVKEMYVVMNKLQHHLLGKEETLKELEVEVLHRRGIYAKASEVLHKWYEKFRADPHGFTLRNELRIENDQKKEQMMKEMEELVALYGPRMCNLKESHNLKEVSHFQNKYVYGQYAEYLQFLCKEQKKRLLKS